MKSLEVTGKTIEEAVNCALEELGVGRDDVEIEIIERPSKGFLGLIGQKDAKVRVTKKPDPVEIATEFIKNTCLLMGLVVKVNYQGDEDEYLKIDIIADNPGLLIGRRGETLDSLQYLANLVVNKKLDKRCKIILDTEGYRQKREEALKKLASKLSQKVKRNRKNITLEPMTPHERKIIHTALQSDPKVKTYSEGEEPHRRVVIALKNGK